MQSYLVKKPAKTGDRKTRLSIRVLVMAAFPVFVALAAAPRANASLSTLYQQSGKISWSIDGLGVYDPNDGAVSGIIQVEKPVGATVRKAYLLAASNDTDPAFPNGATIPNGDVQIDGVGVNWDSSVPTIFTGTNYQADVTTLVKPKIDAAVAGRINFNITELHSRAADGEILVVIFDNPNETTNNTVILEFGAQNPNGDNFNFPLTAPISASTTAIQMSLGISFSAQEINPNPVVGGNPPLQFSTVDVGTTSANATRLTTSAGGQDDGALVDNDVILGGSLITVGGLDDLPTNPSPTALPMNTRTDDELYDLLPFLPTGATNIFVNTTNPSNNDNILFAGFFLRGNTVNAVPVANNDTVKVAQNAGPTPINVLANDTDADPADTLTVTAVTQPAHGTVTFTATGVTYTPTAGYSGPDSFTYTISDGNGGTSTATVNVTVNTPPVAVGDAYSTNEDAPLTVTANGVLGNDTDANGDALTAVLGAGPSNGMLTLNPNGGFLYMPNANFFGADSFTYRANDGFNTSALTTVNLTVNSVNDAPTFTAAVNPTVNEDSGAQTIAGVATAISAGPANESGQTVAFTTTNNNNALFSMQPTLSANGTLSFTPAANANGTATVTVVLKDNGGTANGGVDTSVTKTFTITVNPVNDAPTFTIGGNQTVNEDSGPQTTTIATNISVGPANESTQTPAFTTTNNNNALFSVQPTISATGVLNYTPAANANGTATVTVVLKDNGGIANGGVDTSTTQTFTITVTAVNDNPVAGNQNVTTPEDTPLAITLTSTDIDGGAPTYTVTGGPSNGTLSGTGATRTYTPNPNYNGPDSFTFSVSDGNGGTSTGTVNINVTPVNDPPVAGNQSVTTMEDTSLPITLTSTDTDGGTPTYTITGGPSHGTLSGSGANRTYVPAANYNGPDSFTFSVSDGNGGTSTGTVNITVTPVNDAPVAVNDNYTATEDTTLTIPAPGVLDNDTDVDNFLLTATLVVAPTHGTVTLNANGSFSYVPDANYSGPDSFTYIANDGTTNSNIATVNINVTSVNDNPVAGNQNVTTMEDTALPITLTSTDTDGGAPTYTITGGPSNGTLSGTGANLTYTPNTNYNGPDSFTFSVSDGNGGTATGTININVTPVNDAPVAVNDNYTATEDTTLTVPAPGVLGNDTDVDNVSLNATLVLAPTHGMVTLNSNGSFSYVPDANYNGPDSFTYFANDGTTNSNTATVNINVTAVNDNPVAGNQNVTTAEDTALPIVLTSTDSDGGTPTYTVTGGPAHGTLTGTGANLTYTPDANYNGPDVITFTVDDGNGGTSTGTININVTPVNDAPTVRNQNVTTPEDTPLPITLISSDIDGGTPTYTVTGGPSHGTLTGTGANLTYTPAANYNGPDSFTFSVSDGNGGTASGTVNITVTPVNDAPIAVNDSATTPANTAVAINVLGNDSDIDGGTLSIVGTPTAAHGTVVVNNGIITYTPTPGYAGSDSFTYTISDGQGGTASATVSITVTGANDVTPVVGIKRGSFVGSGRYLPSPFRQGNRLTQVVTLHNNSNVTLQGPISLVLDNLSNGVLTNRTGVTTLSGSPYINVAPNGLAPGQSVSVTLQFTSSNNNTITYSTRVLSGPGPR